VPEKRYRAVVDVRLNLERWLPHLDEGCLKIFHGETAHWQFHNKAQEERLQTLFERRGVRLRPNKMLEPNRAIESADCGLVLGNDFTLGTYRFAGTPLEPLVISSQHSYPALERDYRQARRHFLWFGSGGLVHKGLDRVLETFAGLPSYELTVCGPVHLERDFERAYYRELYDLPNVHTMGWVDISSPQFVDLARGATALLYPSCSEGQCGGVITSMHAGLIPIVSKTSGVPIADDYGVELEDCEISTLRDAVLALSQRPEFELRAMSERARAYARAHHTHEAFATRYRDKVESLLGRATASS
jgi:glycosyltransferase involved in cell wall biosynthesis